jgi:hypothetical protein
MALHILAARQIVFGWWHVLTYTLPTHDGGQHK